MKELSSGQDITYDLRKISRRRALIAIVGGVVAATGSLADALHEDQLNDEFDSTLEDYLTNSAQIRNKQITFSELISSESKLVEAHRERNSRRSSLKHRAYSMMQLSGFGVFVLAFHDILRETKTVGPKSELPQQNK